jgi:hypothetical protein
MRPWSKCERHAKRCVREATPTIGALLTVNVRQPSYVFTFNVGIDLLF